MLKNTDISLIEKFIFENDELSSSEIIDFNQKVTYNLEFNAHYKALNTIKNNLIEKAIESSVEELFKKKKFQTKKNYLLIAASVIAVLGIALSVFYKYDSKIMPNQEAFISIKIPFIDESQYAFGFSGSKSIDSISVLIQTNVGRDNTYIFDDTLRLNFSKKTPKLSLLKKQNGEYTLKIDDENFELTHTLSPIKIPLP